MQECKRCKEEAPLQAGYCKKCLKAQGFKLCNTCGELKLALIDFYKKRGICKECSSSTPHLTREERYYNGYLKRTYGITLERYDAILKSQNGGCAICGNPPGKRKLHVDHDHETGKVRGLLCSTCNVMLGMAQDSRHILHTALDYLDKHNSDRLITPEAPTETPSLEVRKLEWYIADLRAQIERLAFELNATKERLVFEMPDPDNVVAFLLSAKRMIIERFKIKDPDRITEGPLAQINELVRQIKESRNKPLDTPAPGFR